MYNKEQQRSLQQKIKTNQFNLEDLAKQIEQIKKNGKPKTFIIEIVLTQEIRL